MRRIVFTAAAAAALIAQSAAAQPYGPGPGPGPGYRSGGPPGGSAQAAFQDGYRAGYRAGYQAGRIRARYDDRPVLTTYGPSPGDPEQRWRQRYGQTYGYNDDSYYRECRNQPDPGAVIAGALIGGLVGNAAGRGGARPATTVAGVVIGGAVGGALTSRMDCADRSYAYKTYYDGFNSGRPHSDWQWDNPEDGHYGDFRVGDYYTDPDGFRCATYTQQIWVRGEPEAVSGRACQQPDGTWAVVN